MIIIITTMNEFPDVGCRNIAEIVLLVDTSSRIYQESNFQNLWTTYYQGFMLNFVQGFNIAQSKTRVAIITYNSSPSIRASLTDSMSLTAVENYIFTIQPTNDNNVQLRLNHYDYLKKVTFFASIQKMEKINLTN